MDSAQTQTIDSEIKHLLDIALDPGRHASQAEAQPPQLYRRYGIQILEHSPTRLICRGCGPGKSMYLFIAGWFVAALGILLFASNVDSLLGTHAAGTLHFELQHGSFFGFKSQTTKIDVIRAQLTHQDSQDGKSDFVDLQTPAGTVRLGTHNTLTRAEAEAEVNKINSFISDSGQSSLEVSDDERGLSCCGASFIAIPGIILLIMAGRGIKVTLDRSQDLLIAKRLGIIPTRTIEVQLSPVDRAEVERLSASLWPSYRVILILKDQRHIPLRRAFVGGRRYVPYKESALAAVINRFLENGNK